MEKLDFSQVPQVVRWVEIESVLVGMKADGSLVPLAKLASVQTVQPQTATRAYTGKPRGRKPKVQVSAPQNTNAKATDAVMQ